MCLSASEQDQKCSLPKLWPPTAPSLSYFWNIGLHVLEDATLTGLPWLLPLCW